MATLGLKKGLPNRNPRNKGKKVEKSKLTPSENEKRVIVKENCFPKVLCFRFFLTGGDFFVFISRDYFPPPIFYLHPGGMSWKAVSNSACVAPAGYPKQEINIAMPRVKPDPMRWAAAVETGIPLKTALTGHTGPPPFTGFHFSSFPFIPLYPLYSSLGQSQELTEREGPAFWHSHRAFKIAAK